VADTYLKEVATWDGTRLWAVLWGATEEERLQIGPRVHKITLSI
jgi:hypothetical protein